MKSNNESGFVLLEIIMAIALFSVVATSMVVALDRLSVASNVARKEARIFRRMDSVMMAVIYRPQVQLQVGGFSYPADASGVKVDVEITPESYIAQSGMNLDDMFRVVLNGSLVGEPDIIRTLERVVYSPPADRREGGIQ